MRTRSIVKLLAGIFQLTDNFLQFIGVESHREWRRRQRKRNVHAGIKSFTIAMFSLVEKSNNYEGGDRGNEIARTWFHERHNTTRNERVYARARGIHYDYRYRQIMILRGTCVTWIIRREFRRHLSVMIYRIDGRPLLFISKSASAKYAHTRALAG